MAQHFDLKLATERAAIVLLLAGSMAVNVGLYRRVAPLLSLSPVDSVDVGDELAAVDVLGADGKVGRLALTDTAKPVLLLIVSPSCGWCKKNMPAMNALATQAAETFQVVGLSLSPDGLPEFVKQFSPAFRIHAATTEVASRFVTIPDTMVLSKSGIVLRAWGGVYKEPFKAQLEEFFGVTLPAPPPPVVVPPSQR